MSTYNYLENFSVKENRRMESLLDRHEVMGVLCQDRVQCDSGLMEKPNGQRKHDYVREFWNFVLK